MTPPTWDISFPLRPGMPGFPGDPAFSVTPVRRIARGDPYNLSSLALGTHVGTHLDPPVHFISGGDPVDRIDPARLNGPVAVVRVPESATEVGPEAVRALPEAAERVLFRTRNSTRWAREEGFFADYVGLTVEAAQALLGRGVRLVGIDSFSIEHDVDGTFPVHHRLLGNGALILEGLRLGEVDPGAFELRCLPLRIVDGDGGPARAILLRPG